VKYMCLIYQDETLRDRMDPEEADAVQEEYVALGAALERSGHYVGGSPLLPTSAATTVRVRRDRLSTTDGPFAETKEQLGGYILIEATALDDAIQIAARIPGARVGCVEVRPLRELQRTGQA
jgi:hypothetical protein